MTFGHSGGRPILSHPAIAKYQGVLRTAAPRQLSYCSINSVWLVTL
jgi:hypothetical protein